jgi:hypothetical protein
MARERDPSAFCGAGRDFMIISGHMLPLATPMTVAELASRGITATGSVSLPVLYEFPTTDLTATFRRAPVPELPTWGLMARGFVGLTFQALASQASARRTRRKRPARRLGWR